MKQLTSKLTKRQRVITFSVITIALVIAGFFLLRSHAATTAIALEAENFLPTKPAEIVTDSNASAGKAVQFKKDVVNPPPSTGCTDANLLFCDDFTGASGSAPDSSKWSILSGASGWGVECWSSSPNHLQVTKDPDGVSVLQQTVSKESGCSGRSYLAVVAEVI